MLKILLKDNCTNEFTTLEKAIEHIINYELKEDTHNSVIYESIKNLSSINLENYDDKLSLTDMIELIEYYDYQLV